MYLLDNMWTFIMCPIEYLKMQTLQFVVLHECNSVMNSLNRRDKNNIMCTRFVCWSCQCWHHWRYDMIILSGKISSVIWYDIFQQIFIINDMIWYFWGNIYHQRYDMIIFQVKNIINDMIWYFLANIYHQWYDMIFLREYLSSTIRYDNFFVLLIINDIWCDLLKTKLTFPRNTSISKNFVVLVWLKDFSVLKFLISFSI